MKSITNLEDLSPELQQKATELNVRVNATVWQEPADKVEIPMLHERSFDLAAKGGLDHPLPMMRISFRRVRETGEGRGRYMFESMSYESF